MAGGIFVDQPFHPNLKCIIFSIALMLAYWMLPQKNPFMLPLIFVVAYVSMAWYDYMYNCDMKMYGGKYGGYLSSPFKPQRREQNEQQNEQQNKDDNKNLLKDQESKYRQKVNLLHILVINPIFIYIGYMGKKSNPLLFPLVLAIALITFIYHGARMFINRQVTNCPKDKVEEVKNEISYLKSVYIMHFTAIAPLLLYVGIKGNKSDVRVFPILLALGIVSDIYHLFRLWKPRPTIKC
tara:strand:- start:904 stop:1617 length:714 start_codon:yes stop_codon:yes gene_type:complete